jgi:hypothetical protein
VRHTSNELYADVVETLSVTLAPSGRPLAALASGTIAFTSKVSGVPDILVTLTGPSGKHNLRNILDLPVFHPCVRLARWREQPGLLSFVPPDGRFTLAGYEVDLMPLGGPLGGEGVGGSSGSALTAASQQLKLPVSLEVKTGLGPAGSDFEVRAQVNRVFGSTGSTQPAGRGLGLAGSGGGGGGPGATTTSPSLYDLKVSVPLPADVRNLSEIRPSKGDATYNPGDRALEWSISNKDLAQGITSFVLRCTVVGHVAEDEDDDSDPTGFGFNAAHHHSAYSYDDEPYQSSAALAKQETGAAATDTGGADKDERKTAQNRILMPSSASVSFAVKGWLASGIRVESIVVDPRKSRGLAEHVKPYKGVKYLTVSNGGVEIRC